MKAKIWKENVGDIEIEGSAEEIKGFIAEMQRTRNIIVPNTSPSISIKKVADNSVYLPYVKKTIKAPSTKKPYKWLTNEESNFIVSLSKQGLTTYAISQKVGRSCGCVYNVLKRNGIKPVTEHPKKSKKNFDPSKLEELKKRMIEVNERSKIIGQLYNVDFRTAKRMAFVEYKKKHDEEVKQ